MVWAMSNTVPMKKVGCSGSVGVGVSPSVFFLSAFGIQIVIPCSPFFTLLLWVRHCLKPPTRVALGHWSATSSWLWMLKVCPSIVATLMRWASSLRCWSVIWETLCMISANIWRRSAAFAFCSSVGRYILDSPWRRLTSRRVIGWGLLAGSPQPLGFMRVLESVWVCVTGCTECRR